MSVDRPTSVRTRATLAAVAAWFGSLERYNEDFPAKGTIAGALVVLDRLKSKFDLDIESHTAKGGSQVKGASGAAVKRILAVFGETRRFVAEGGRTNRGLRGDIKKMLDAIQELKLQSMTESSRNDILVECQRFLCGKVTTFFSQKRLDCKYSPNLSAYQFVGGLLKAAKDRGKEGPVAQYLVGAKLQLRFPEEQIENKSYSTADAPQDKHGDFFLGDTVFHVTVAPGIAVLEKCQRNITDNLRPWLLVPDRSIGLFRSEAEANVSGPFTLDSIESFVSQNVAELASFSGDLLPTQLLQLIDIYNERVAAIEVDQSMLIEIPAALERLKGSSR